VEVFELPDLLFCMDHLVLWGHFYIEPIHSYDSMQCTCCHCSGSYMFIYNCLLLFIARSYLVCFYRVIDLACLEAFTFSKTECHGKDRLVISL